MYAFRWIEWNIDHIAEHGVWPEDAEFVVNHAKPPFPRIEERDKRRVWGRAPDGTHLQVSYILDPDGTVFVIHAMPLTDRQKTQLQRQKRRRGK